MSFKGRFEGVNASQLIQALRQQPMIRDDEECAKAFAAAGNLVEFAAGEAIITQGAYDNGLYLLVAGTAAIVVNGAQVAIRRAGDSVGEMAAIEPSQPRAAMVNALETVVALAIDNDKFHEIGRAYGQIWEPLARVLAKRLFERNKTIRPANASPKVFIISSSESLPVAHALRDGLEKDAYIKVWDQGVFFAGGYVLEALEKEVSESDFAVAVAEPDDIVKIRGKTERTLRDNVLFELGLFMGQLTRFRSVLMLPGIKGVRIPSDLQGLTLLRYEDGGTPIAERIAPVCDAMRDVIKRLGVKTAKFDE